MSRLALPVGMSLLFIGWSPFIGQIRDWVKVALGANFVPVVSVLLVLVVVGASGWAVRHIRHRRRLRYGLIGLAAGCFVAYAATMTTGLPDVDAVERLHFAEYGLVATLFYRALRPGGLGPAVLLTLLSGTLVGIGEEWLQWLVPTRVGDVRDVFLNFYALGCGLLFAVGLYPPAAFGWQLSLAHWQTLLRLAAIVTVAFAGFFHCAHLGYQHDTAAIGRFRSFFTMPQLSAIAAERTARWRRDPPAGLSPLAIQDHYLIEAGSHVLHRNAFLLRGQYRDAWLENQLLERYYDPVLDTRSFSTGELHRWAAAQRDEVERLGGAGETGGWESPVGLDRVYVWPSKPRFWTATAAVVCTLLALAALVGRRSMADGAWRP